MALAIVDALDFLRGMFQEEITDLERLFGGDWSEAFSFRCGDRYLVARFGAHKDDFERDELAYCFNSIDLPVPEVLCIEPHENGYCCISERLFGEVIDRLDGPRMSNIVPAVFRLLDALRDADTSIWCRRLPEVGTWPERLLSIDRENDRVFGWHEKMAQSRFGDSAYQTGLSFLRANVDALPDRADLLHNDLLHNNVLVQGDRISGVFDWGCAGLGDFVYELASFTLYAPWHPGMLDIDWVAETKRHYREIALDVTDLEIRLKCYEVHLAISGLAYSAFRENWTDYEAVAQRMLERMD